jgi:signal transduction histidine kinase
VGDAALFPIRIDHAADRQGDGEFAAAELARLLRTAADLTQTGLVITTHPKGSDNPGIVYMNPAFAALAGSRTCDLAQTDAARPSMPSAKDHPLWSSLRQSHQTDDVFSMDIVLRDESGSRKVFCLRSSPVRDDSGQITHRVAIVPDMTQRADMEDVLRRNERLASVGLLAAGIAHEVNNPAGSALLAAETALAIMDLPESGPQVAACLRNIVTSIDRCGRIVRTLLRYTHEEPAERQACSINDVAKQAQELARPYAERYGAELHLELDPSVPLAPMNPLEIELVLVNLVRNAIEAGMEKRNRGGVAISIRTERTDAGIRVAVSDNGCGMSQEQLTHVLDPLYTTRRQVGGSGLGMSIANGIVQGYGGHLEVRSQTGVGTTVTMDLPVATGPLVIQKW